MSPFIYFSICENYYTLSIQDVHSRVFQRSSQAAKPQKAGSDQNRGECACKRTGGGSAALRREGEAKQTLLQRGQSVIKGFVKIQ